ncbi:MAG: hypothetical protein LUF90_05175 [Rikenellaceae bacterium]|nr:hypothetical protein [Rikenellaceae bacterium]
MKTAFINLQHTEEKCVEWHLWYNDNSEKLWQIDIIQILKDSKYDGYFEKVADDILATSTPEQRELIIKMKHETPDEIKIPGMEYYIAVIKHGIKNYSDFTDWRNEHKFDGIIEW